MRIVLLSHYYYPEVGAPQRRWRILNDHLRAAGHEIITSHAPKVRTEKKVYPNDPCPCGSGLKYKQCCGKKK